MSLHQLKSKTLLLMTAACVHAGPVWAGVGGGDAHGDPHHAESSGGLPQLDFSTYPTQIFWLAVCFGGLYLFFSRSVLPNLSGTIETRRERVQGDLDEAENLKEEAERVHKAYDEVLEDSRKKSTEFFLDAETEIKAEAADKLEALREKAAKETAAAEERIEEAKKEAMKDMDAIAAEISSKAAEKIIGIPTDIKQAQSVIQNITKKAA